MAEPTNKARDELLSELTILSTTVFECLFILAESVQRHWSDEHVAAMIGIRERVAGLDRLLGAHHHQMGMEYKACGESIPGEFREK